MIQPGMKLKPIFFTPLPGNTEAPPLDKDFIYTCDSTFTDKGGNLHVNVGIISELNFIRSYGTKEILPGDFHWCHPNRFIIVG